jgi:hypothetical protein
MVENCTVNNKFHHRDSSTGTGRTRSLAGKRTSGAWPVGTLCVRTRDRLPVRQMHAEPGCRARLLPSLALPSRVSTRVSSDHWEKHHRRTPSAITEFGVSTTQNSSHRQHRSLSQFSGTDFRANTEWVLDLEATTGQSPWRSWINREDSSKHLNFFYHCHCTLEFDNLPQYSEFFFLIVCHWSNCQWTVAKM